MKRLILLFVRNIFLLPYLIIKLLILSGPRFSRERKFRFLKDEIMSCINRAARVTYDFDGMENLPAEPGYLITPNHQGLFDILTLLTYFDEPFSVVTKKENMDYFLLKKVAELVDAEVMDRSDVRQSMTVIQNVSKRLSAGETFVIFPEGTRSKKGNTLGDFKPGSFKAATMAKAPIVPVALTDSFIPLDSNSIAPVTVKIRFLEPLYYEDYKDMKTPEIAALVSSRIQAKVYETAGIDPDSMNSAPASEAAEE